jgi:hypothetical protein
LRAFCFLRGNAATKVQVDVLKADVKKRYTLGEVYVPNEFDTQGDMATPEEVEKACWNYMRRLQGLDPLTKLGKSLVAALAKAHSSGGSLRLDVTEIWADVEKGAALINDMHERDLTGEQPEVVECYTAPADFTAEAPEGTRMIKKGTWLLGVIWPQAYFQKILDRERTGYSMEGRGRRVPVG